MQETWVQYLVWEDSTCLPQLLSLCAETIEARVPRTYAPPQEKPLQ